MAGAGLTLVLVTVLLTYSRGGILALAMAVAVTMAFLPGRGAGLAALVAGVAGCLLPAAFALTDPLLSADQIPTALREDAGLGLGWRLAVGLAAGAVLAVGLARWAARLHLDPARVRRIGAVVVAVLLVGVVATFAASGGARDWAGDRVGEFRGEGGDAVGNDPGRLVNASGNQRRGWWEEAWRGFEAAPVLGSGEGGEHREGEPDLGARVAVGAAGVVLAAAAPGGPDGPRRPRALVAGALGALVAVAVLSAALPWWSTRVTREGDAALADGRAAEAVDLARDARAANPLSTPPLLLLGQAYTDLNDLPRALGAYQAATRLQPENPETWRALAIFLGPDGTAAAAWRQVHRLDPQDPEAAIRAG